MGLIRKTATTVGNAALNYLSGHPLMIWWERQGEMRDGILRYQSEGSEKELQEWKGEQSKRVKGMLLRRNIQNIITIGTFVWAYAQNQPAFYMLSGVSELWRWKDLSAEQEEKRKERTAWRRQLGDVLEEGCLWGGYGSEPQDPPEYKP